MDLVCVGYQVLEFVQNASEATGDGCEKTIVKAAFELQSSLVLEKQCNAEFYPWNLPMILAIQSLQISPFENLFFNHGLDLIDCNVTVGCHNYCRFLIKNWMLLRLRQCRKKPFILVNLTRWTAHALISSCLLHTSGTSPNLLFWLIPSTSLLSRAQILLTCMDIW